MKIVKILPKSFRTVKPVLNREEDRESTMG